MHIVSRKPDSDVLDGKDISAATNDRSRDGSRPESAVTGKAGSVWRDWMSAGKLLPIRILVLMLVLLSESRFVYFALGFINLRFRFLHSLFLCYAGSPKYAEYYSFKVAQKWLKWRPAPIGFIRQGGKWGLAFGCTMSEQDFSSDESREMLFLLIKRLETIADIAAVPKITLAGILPSYLDRLDYKIKGNDNRMPALAVYQSYWKLSSAEFDGNAVPAILLGGNGSVGSRIQQLFDNAGQTYFVVDPLNGLASLPHSIKGKPCILIDVSRSGVLQTYADYFWAGMVILNETFPEPGKEMIKALNRKGIRVFHLTGVEGRIYPSLPHGYQNSVPCCAIHGDSSKIKPVLRRLGI